MKRKTTVEEEKKKKKMMMIGATAGEGWQRGGVMTEEQYELLRRQIVAFGVLSDMLYDSYYAMIRRKSFSRD
ncbi:hypothetical protein QJS04_geneDACA019008 [Acorus gramineus]|uniref:Uncharacterized protein n=1 Tax=Acorus gramineus TaxID=55184 RepID=A0AAV9BE66_ACOGR|nr:hypothetical protein QJS04_geneDACA019008 [Acorus gramineus]